MGGTRAAMKNKIIMVAMLVAETAVWAGGAIAAAMVICKML